MSDGPAIVPMTRRPAGDEVLDGASGTLPVVDVHEARRHALRRATNEHQRNRCQREAGQEHVIVVEAHHHGAVDVPGDQVVGRPLRVLGRFGHQEHELRGHAP